MKWFRGSNFDFLRRYINWMILESVLRINLLNPIYVKHSLKDLNQKHITCHKYWINYEWINKRPRHIFVLSIFIVSVVPKLFAKSFQNMHENRHKFMYSGNSEGNRGLASQNFFWWNKSHLTVSQAKNFVGDTQFFAGIHLSILWCDKMYEYTMKYFSFWR